MPRRSNDFQRLIKRIYEQLLPTGALITESAMLTDSKTGDAREVDILIEITTPGIDTPTRIAIECRDHGRTSDTTWVDQLIGKYADLPVNRIIAVSRKSFTGSAQRKAQRSNIETRSLAEALATDWPKELFEVDFTNVLHWPVVTEVSVVSDPPWPEGENVSAARIGGTSVERLGLATWQRTCFARTFAAAVAQQRKIGAAEFDEPGCHAFRVTLSPSGGDLVFLTTDGIEHRIVQLTLGGEVTVEHQPLPHKRYRFGRVGVTRAKGAVYGGDVDVLAVQEPGSGLSVRVEQTVNRPKSWRRHRPG